VRNQWERGKSFGYLTSPSRTSEIFQVQSMLLQEELCALAQKKNAKLSQSIALEEILYMAAENKLEDIDPRRSNRHEISS
jgi:hypothetical protein